MFTKGLREIKEYNKSLRKFIVLKNLYNCYTFTKYVS